MGIGGSLLYDIDYTQAKATSGRSSIRWPNGTPVVWGIRAYLEF